MTDSRFLAHCLDEVHYFFLGPETVVAFGSSRDESAVSSVGRRKQGDIWVRGYLLGCERSERDEGIILRVNDHYRNGNILDVVKGTRPFVIVGHVSKTGVRRRVDVIELADGPDASQPRFIVSLRV